MLFNTAKTPRKIIKASHKTMGIVFLFIALPLISLTSIVKYSLNLHPDLKTSQKSSPISTQSPPLNASIPIHFSSVSEGSFKYLGCCTDMENDVRDLNGLSTTFRNFKVRLGMV